MGHYFSDLGFFLSPDLPPAPPPPGSRGWDKSILASPLRFIMGLNIKLTPIIQIPNPKFQIPNLKSKIE